MLVKVIKGYRDIVTICDSNLIGKRFEENNFQLDLQKEFFKGEETSEKEVIQIIQKMLKEDASFNIVGKNSINIAIKEGIISKQGIKEIQGIPFALILL